MNFSKNKIRSEEESVAEKLKTKRESLGLTIEKASEKISIKKEYLKIIESGEYEKLPGGVYQKTFIKKYSSFLGLETKKIESCFLKESGIKEKSDQNIFSRKKIKKSAFLVFPKILRIFLVTIIALAVFLYLGFYLKNSLSKPKIEIFEPVDNLITENNSIYVSGKTNPKTQIKINDLLILKDDSGNFRELIELKKGVNTIIVSAQNKYSQKNIIKKQILVK